jgi:hypothetical protein
MRISKVFIGHTNTVNTGNYQSIRPSSGATVELETDDNVAEAIQLARKASLEAYVQSAEDLILIEGYTGKFQEKYTEEVIRKMIANADEQIRFFEKDKEE